MTVIQSAFIGTTNSIANASVDKSVDFIELQNGTGRFQHPRELTVSISREKTEGQYFGICDNDSAANTESFGGVGAVIESATHTRTDVVGDRQMATHLSYAAEDGSFVAPAGEYIIQYTDNMLWLGYEDTLSFTIKYQSDTVPPANMRKSGARVITPVAIHPALYPDAGVYPAGSTLGDAPGVTEVVSALAAMEPVAAVNASTANYYFVRSVNFSQNADDWHTMAVELNRFVPNTDLQGDTSPLLGSLALWRSAGSWTTLGLDYMFVDASGSNDFPAYYSATITVSLTAGGTPTRNESIEFFASDTDMTDYMTLNT